MALSIRIADSYWAKAPGNTIAESKRGRVVITIKDNSLDHANVPIVPNPIGKRMIDGFPFLTGQTNNSTLHISTQPLLYDETFLKETAHSQGGTMIAQLARLVAQNDIEVRTSAGALLTANDLLTATF
jgi:hypothetical protein